MCWSRQTVLPQRLLLLALLVAAGAGAVQLAVGVYFFLPVPVLRLGSNIWTGAWNLVAGAVMAALGWRQALAPSSLSLRLSSSRLHIQLTLSAVSLALSIVNVVVVELGEWRLMRHHHPLLPPPSVRNSVVGAAFDPEAPLRLARAASDAASVVASVASFLAAHLAFCLLQQPKGSSSYPLHKLGQKKQKQVSSEEEVSENTVPVPPPPPPPVPMSNGRDSGLECKRWSVSAAPVKEEQTGGEELLPLVHLPVDPPAPHFLSTVRPALSSFHPAPRGSSATPSSRQQVAPLVLPPPSPSVGSHRNSPSPTPPPSTSSGYGSPDACCVSYRQGPRGAITVIAVGSKGPHRSEFGPGKKRRTHRCSNPRSFSLRRSHEEAHLRPQPITRSVSFCDSVLRRGSSDWISSSASMSELSYEGNSRSPTPVSEEEEENRDVAEEGSSLPSSPPSSLASPSPSPLPTWLLDRLLGRNATGRRAAMTSTSASTAASLASLVPPPFLREVGLDHSDTLAYLSELELLARHWRTKLLQRQTHHRAVGRRGRGRNASEQLRGAPRSHSHC